MTNLMHFLPSPVCSLAWGPDDLIAAGTSEGNIYLYGLDEKQQPRVLKGVGGKVLTVAFSPDGARLASGGTDQELALWEVATGQHIVSKPFPYPVSKVVWTSHGDRFMVVSGPEISTWSMDGHGLPDQETRDYCSLVVDATWSPDGTYFAAVTADQHFAVWDATTCRDAFAPVLLPDAPSAVACLPRSVMVGSRKGIIYTLSPIDGQVLFTSQLSEAPIRALNWASALPHDTFAMNSGPAMSLVEGDHTPYPITTWSSPIAVLSGDGQRVAEAREKALWLHLLPLHVQN